MTSKTNIEQQTAELEQLMTDRLQLIANYTAQAIPDGWGFAVIICPLGVEPTSVLYVSNADFVDMLETVEEWIKQMRQGNYHRPTEDELKGGNA